MAVTTRAFYAVAVSCLMAFSGLAQAEFERVPDDQFALEINQFDKQGKVKFYHVDVTNISSEAFTGPLKLKVTGVEKVCSAEQHVKSKKSKKSKKSDKSKKSKKSKKNDCDNEAGKLKHILNALRFNANGFAIFRLNVESLGAGETTQFVLEKKGVRVTHIEGRLLQSLAPAPELATVSIDSPQSLVTVGTSQITVLGTVNELAQNLTVNGVAIPVVNQSFAALVDLTEGFNTIVARVTNAAGVSATANITVTLDQTPPVLSVDSHVNGQVVGTANVVVTGLVNDIVRGTVNEGDSQVLINGVPASVSNKSFALEVALQEGNNTLLIEATDAVNNLSVLSLDLTYVPPTGKVIALVAGQNQTGQIGSILPQPLQVLVTNNDVPVSGAQVIYTVEQGSGSLDGVRAKIAVSDANGFAQLPFKVGNRVGVANQKVQAIANGYNSVTFTASTVGLPGNKITINSGNNQRGSVGAGLPAPLVVTVSDAGSNVVAGASVLFEVLQGGGVFGNGAASQQFTTDSNGRVAATYQLGALAGADAQRIRATLQNPNGQTFTATFSATAFVPADPALTTISGTVLDNQDNPLPGTTVRVEGTNRNAVAGPNGRFTITQAPVGPVHLVVDGSTTTVAGEYPSLGYNLVTVAGVNNTLPSPIYMVRLNTVNRVFAGPANVSITLQDFPGFQLDIAKDSVTFPDGSRQGFVSVTPVNTSKIPMAPPDGLQPQFIVTIQPSGARFDPPARLTLPNVDGKAPGEQFEMFSYDHDLEEFVGIGLGTVSNDGLVVRSNPGVGVVKAGWHGGAQPNETGTVIGTSNEACVSETVQLLNRNTSVQGNGTWDLANIPSNQGFVKARSTCDKADGSTLIGETQYFEIVSNQTVGPFALNYVAPAPVPVSLDFSPGSELNLETGDTDQSVLIATFSDTSTQNVTNSSSGINYTSSNANVASVTANGLITATGPGFALIVARKDGVSDSRGVVVVAPGGVDTDGDGIIDSLEIALGLDPNNPVDAVQDVDLDGLNALEEIANGTDIFDADTDDDGLSDGDEVNIYGTNALLADTDGDGVRDGLEVATFTDPNNAGDVDLEAALDSIAIDPNAGTILYNSVIAEGSLQVSVTGLMLDGATIDLTNDATYGTDNAAICFTSGSTGEVFAGQPGPCTLTASFGSYSATGQYQVVVFNPSSSGFVDLPGAGENLAIVGDTVYVAAFGDGLIIVDVSSRNSPQVIGSYVMPDARDVAVTSGGLLAVGAGSEGLVLLDVSDPLAPVELGRLDNVALGDVDALVSYGNRAFTTSNSANQSHIVDISDPANMVSLGSFGEGGNGIDADALSGFMAIADGSQVHVLDISTETNPLSLGAINSGNATDVDFVNGSLLVGDASLGLSSWNPLDLAAAVDSVPVNNSGLINDMFSINGVTFGADTFFANGVSVTDSRFAPQLAAQVILDFSNVRDDDGRGVTADDQFVYLLGNHPGGPRLYIGQYLADQDSSQFEALGPNPGMLELRSANSFFGEDEPSMQVFVRRALGSVGVVSVDYSTYDGTQIANQDYVPVTGTLIWGDGDTSLKSFNIPIIDDAVIEPAEYLNARLSNPTGGAILGTQTTLVGQIDDESDPQFAGLVAPRQFGIRVQEDEGNLPITFVRLGASSGALTVDYNGPAFGLGVGAIPNVSGQLLWADGDQTPQVVNVPIIDDFAPEVMQRAYITVNSNNYAAFDVLAELQVTDNDGGPTAGRLEFSARSFRTTESNSTLEVTVLRKGGAFGLVTVDYATQDFEGIEGIEYIATSGTLTWPDGDNTPRVFTVDLLDDASPGDSNFLLTLANPTGGAQVGPVATGRLFDNDNDEDDLDGDGYPNFADVDDDGDTLFDGEELAFGLNPLDASDAGDVDGDGFTSIDEIRIYGTDPLDPNDFPRSGRVEIESSFSVVDEDEGQIEMRVQRRGGILGAISVDYTTVAGNATDPDDFVAVSGTLNWADGDDAVKSFFVPISDDGVIENIEYLFAQIENPVNTEIVFARTMIEVIDDDSAPHPGAIRLRHSRLATPEDAGSVTYEVIRTGSDVGDVSIDYAVTPNSISIGNDVADTTGTFTWADGDSSVRFITVSVVDDNEEEKTERFNIDFSNPVGGVGFIRTDSELILDNDSTRPGGYVGFSRFLHYVLEGETSARVPIVRLGGKQGDTGLLNLNSFSYNTANPGLENQDFVNVSSQIQFADGDDAVKYLDVTLLEDNVFEPIELFLGNINVPDTTVAAADYEFDDFNDYVVFVAFDDDRPLDGGVVQFPGATLTVSEAIPEFVIERVGGGTGAVAGDVTISGTGATNEVLSFFYFIQEEGQRAFTLNGVDPLVNGDRTVTVNLGNLAGLATLGTSTLTITIKDDADGDGAWDEIDDFPNDPAETTDTDGDGTGDNADTDDDNDGRDDDFEALIGSDPLNADAPLDPVLENCLVTFAQARGYTDVSQYTSFECIGQGLNSIAGIENMHALVYANFADNNLTDLAPVYGLGNLRFFFVRNNQLNDLAGISLPAIENLGVDNNNLSDISPLGSLTTLRQLHAGGNHFTDISSLAGLNLELLSIWGSRVTDISVVGGFSQLTYLNIDGNQVSSLPNLPVSMTGLRANHNDITDVSVIAPMTQLTQLALRDNLLTSIPDLSANTDLTYIEIDGNELTALPGLPAGVESLNASNNHIGDLSPLAGLFQINDLHLYNNHLSNEDADAASVLASLTSLTYLNIQNNAIDQFGDLQAALPATQIDSDQGRPILTQLSLVPNDFLDLDVSGQLNYTVAVSDGSNGDLVFASPAPADSELYTFFSSGNQHGTYFHPQAIKGTWVIDEVRLHSGWTINHFALATLFPALDSEIELIGTAPDDVTPPQPISVTVTPNVSEVDVSGGPVSVTWTAVFEETGSGMGFSHLQLVDQFGNLVAETSGNHGDDTISLTYAVGIKGESAVEIGWLNAGDQAFNQQGRGSGVLAAEGLQRRVNVTGSLSPAQVVNGQARDPQGRQVGAPGNQSYEFTVTSQGNVAIAYEWDAGHGHWTDLQIVDAVGNVIAAASNTPRPIVSADLAAGTYTLRLLTDCCGTYAPYTVSFFGPVSSVELDTDSDGTIDTLDDDDDNDGMPDTYEQSQPNHDPLNRFDAFDDPDGDGASNLAEYLGGSDPNDNASTPPTVGDLVFSDAQLVQCLADGGLLSAYAVDLTALHCNGYGITSLQGLEQLSSLETISLDGNDIEDIGPLASLAALQHLNIRNSRISDITALAGLSNLHSVFLGGNRVSDLSALGSLSDLSNVSFYDNRLTGNAIRVLDNMSSLRYLNFDSNNLTELPVGLPAELHGLRINHNRVADLSQVPGLTQLEQLAVRDNDLNAIPDLSGLGLLNYVELDHNNLTALPGLPPGIQTVFASDNHIDDLSPLAGAFQINDLHLSNNHLSNEDADNASVLASLTSLTYINIRDNAIDQFGDLQAALPGVVIDSDQGRPLITQLDLVPDTLDLDVDGQLDYTVSFSDGSNANLRIRAASGAELNLYAGNGQQQGYYFHPQSVKGTWFIDMIEVHSGWRINHFALETLFSQFDSSIELIGTQPDDVTPPQPISVTVTPDVTEVDVSGGAVPVTWTAEFEETGSGVSFIHLVLNDQFGNTLAEANNYQGESTVSLTYPVGIGGESEVLIGWLNAGDQAANNLGRNADELEAAGLQRQVSVIGSVSPDAVVNGQARDPQGRFPGAEGNQSYEFTMTSPGILSIAYDWDLGYGHWTDLELVDANGDLVAAVRYTPRPRLVADLAAGDYTLRLLTDCCGTFDDYTLRWYGAVSGIEVDTDADGVIDALDDDDDNDGMPDAYEQSQANHDPLNRFDAYDDPDGDGANNLAEYVGSSDPNDNASTPPTVGDLAFADPQLTQCLTDLGLLGVYAGDVTDVTCDGYDIITLVGLEQLSAIKNLSLNQNKVTDVTSVAALFSLQNLNMANNRVSDISAFVSLVDLRHIDMGNNRISDISALGDLHQLEGVTLWSNLLSGSAARALDNSPALRHLNFDGNRLTELPLNLPAQLQSLRITGNQVTDLSQLSGALELNHLALGDNNLGSVPSLLSHTFLGHLELFGNNLTALPDLPAGLVYLSVADNQISDLSPLAGSYQIDWLELADNHLQDDDINAVSALASLGTLTNLNIQFNAVANQVSFDELRTALPNTNLVTDEGRPQITSLSLPASVDLNVDNQLVFTVTTSTGEGGFVEMTGPTSAQKTGQGFSSGNASTVFLNAFSEKGNWTVNRVDIHTNSYQFYNAFAVEQLFAPGVVNVTGGNPADLLPPVIQALGVNASSVDVSAGPQLVEFTMNIADADSGISQVDFQVGDQSFSYAATNFFNTGNNTFTVPFGFGALDEVRVSYMTARDHAGNQITRNFQDLIFDGFDTGLTVTGTSPIAGTEVGQFHNPQNDQPGSLDGNPSYILQVDSPGVIAVSFDWQGGGGQWVELDIEQPNNPGDDTGTGTVLANAKYRERHKLGVDLAAAGTYILHVRTHCCGNYESFDLTFLGDISSIELDTDGDGDPDISDLDDDGDGVDDGSDTAPLDWSIQ